MNAFLSSSVVLLMGLLSSAAHANTYVKCGKTADVNSFEVTGYELELSSENDRYSGAVGKNWNMKLGSPDSEWLAPNKNITAKKSKNGDDTIVEIVIKTAQTPSGPVGTVYRLIGLYDDQPTLEKFNMGGITGPVQVGAFQCVGSSD